MSRQHLSLQHTMKDYFIWPVRETWMTASLIDSFSQFLANEHIKVRITFTIGFSNSEYANVEQIQTNSHCTAIQINKIVRVSPIGTHPPTVRFFLLFTNKSFPSYSQSVVREAQCIVLRSSIVIQFGNCIVLLLRILNVYIMLRRRRRDYQQIDAERTRIFFLLNCKHIVCNHFYKTFSLILQLVSLECGTVKCSCCFCVSQLPMQWE